MSASCSCYGDWLWFIGLNEIEVITRPVCLAASYKWVHYTAVPCNGRGAWKQVRKAQLGKCNYKRLYLSPPNLVTLCNICQRNRQNYSQWSDVINCNLFTYFITRHLINHNFHPLLRVLHLKKKKNPMVWFINSSPIIVSRHHADRN